MGFSDRTNYNKSEMNELSAQIANYTKRYEDIITTLKGRVDEMQNYWGTDPDAQALYVQLNSEFKKFKQQFDEGAQMMQEFKRNVDSQISRYEDAERKTKGIIG